MRRQISIQWKLTAISAILIALTCVGLTLAVNISAFHMADIIDAQKTITAMQESSSASMDTIMMQPAMKSQELWGIKLSFGRKSVAFMVLAIAMGSTLTYYVTGKVLRPLKDLTEEVRQITIDTISQPIRLNDSSLEIAELSASFQTMADRLNDAYTLQKRFSADAAHELRTPLAVLQTKIDVFQKEDSHSKEEYDALIAALQKQIVRLRNLTQSLLQITVAEVRSEWAEIRMDELLEDVVSELIPIAQDKHIQLNLICTPCWVRGDIDQLYRVFFNLIENGIKYNVPNGTVTIEVQKMVFHGTQVRISDTGVGIPDDMKPHIFEPFYRVDQSRSRQMGGAGLGLTMVEAIIRQHNGTIRVFDGTAGGTCFSVVFPQHEDMAAR